MITGYVRRQALAVSAPVLVADTIDYLTARFVFMTGDWDGLEVWAHFRQGDTAYDFRLDEDGEITSDQHFNLTEGVWSVYLTGHLYSGGAMLQRISTQVAEVEVVKSGMVNANPFPPIPATVEEQIFAELADHEERLSDVEQNGTGGGTGDITGAVRYDVLQELTDEQQMQARENLGLYRKMVELKDSASVTVVKNSETDAEIIGIKIYPMTHGGAWDEGDTIRVEIGTYVFEGTVSIDAIGYQEYGVFVDLRIPINTLANYYLRYDPLEKKWTMSGGYGFTLETTETMRIYKVQLHPVPQEYIPVLDEIVLNSSYGSGKQFRVTVDDTGVLSATEITE